MVATRPSDIYANHNIYACLANYYYTMIHRRPHLFARSAKYSVWTAFVEQSGAQLACTFRFRFFLFVSTLCTIRIHDLTNHRVYLLHDRFLFGLLKFKMILSIDIERMLAYVLHLHLPHSRN